MNHKIKDGFTDYFDYFVKHVQIDGKVFSLIATVKKQIGNIGGYAYTITLKENKKIKASPTVASQNNGSLKGAGDASVNTVSQSANGVKYSERDSNFQNISRISSRNQRFVTKKVPAGNVSWITRDIYCFRQKQSEIQWIVWN